ncbi:hypothetical protein CIL05_07100 [Virgibacillus profundi]|uniref:Uncharacterized protein n=1 Tax=Virgibacillus profundi TaxID=2024555 RepID=A0A2A2IF05_9BACI|nr:hypothetical protein [Virgibacillus profundi]PAV30227.1 hypothetical protein CIL05_07100 [Virgibacillus profundi]PXY54399.1 hypothetical protein CIT14_07185 [Virgibacillus profundi]
MLAIYGKLKNEKRFRMYNLKEDCFVERKIFVTLFHESQKDELQEDVDYMNKHNPNYIFELRKV